MMRVRSVERSFEPCAESGWYGYDIRLDAPVDDALIESLGALGRLSCIRTLKRPFFTVRAEGFLIRGIAGDLFLRAGFAAKGTPEMDLILEAIEGVVGE